jgi:hypothetical protein
MANKVKWEKLPEVVQRDLLEKYGDLHLKGEIILIVEQQSPKQVFSDWLEWNGIIGYSQVLFDLSALLKVAAS